MWRGALLNDRAQRADALLVDALLNRGNQKQHHAHDGNLALLKKRFIAFELRVTQPKALLNRGHQLTLDEMSRVRTTTSRPVHQAALAHIQGTVQALCAVAAAARCRTSARALCCAAVCLQGGQQLTAALSALLCCRCALPAVLAAQQSCPQSCPLLSSQPPCRRPRSPSQPPSRPLPPRPCSGRPTALG